MRRMHAKNLVLLLLLVLLGGCAAPGATATPTRFARPVAFSPAVSPPSTEAAQGETPTGTADPTDTPVPTIPQAPTVTPTTPPPLDLKDLPPLALKDWPRPTDDNGLGIHFLAYGYYTDEELDREIGRMQSMHLKWALVLYADENMLERAARKFKAAGIEVVWRRTMRPFQRYQAWERDIEILNQVGVPPYMQLYNEPELDAEWEGRDQNWTQFTGNLLNAAVRVYNAGGYPGIQFLDEDNLRRFIDRVHAAKGDSLFKRMFFVAHSYGANHPPGYVEDPNGVLGFTVFAQVFQQRLGFVPPIIVGEGGWKVGSSEDSRFPTIDETLHRDYTMAVFDWFRTGKLSNGKPLPDYLLAFCHWMLAGGQEAGAWYDGFNGNRTLTIQAAEQLPTFTRMFSWDK